MHEGKKPHELKILEIGCGGGIVSENMAKQGFQVLGIDMSPNSVKQARDHAEKEGIKNVEYRVGNAYKLELEDNSIDGVIAADVFEHFHDLPKAIEEIARVLKPGLKEEFLLLMVY